MTTRLVLVLCAVAAATAAMGCGSDSGSAEPGEAGGADKPAARQTPAQTPAQVRAAVIDVWEKSYKAISDGDGEKACSYFTPAYQREWVADAKKSKEEGFEIKGDTCPEVTANLSPYLNALAPDRRSTYSGFRTRGDTASIVITSQSELGRGRRTASFLRVGEDWKISDESEDEAVDGG